jgi:AcrR family transcriptional regulator
VLATAILLDDGIPYADLSVEQIARKAGRSRSTFYVYFSDKRELLLHATQEIAERLYTAAAGWLREPDGNGDVRDALADILSIYRQHPGLLAAVVEASGYDERVREHWRELMGGFVEATERRFFGDQSLTEGEISTASAHAQAFALVWMTERACYQQLTGGGVEDDEALMDALADIWGRSASSSHGTPTSALAPLRADSGRPRSGQGERSNRWGAPSRSPSAVNTAFPKAINIGPAQCSSSLSSSFSWQF